MATRTRRRVPEFFAPILWSYDRSHMDVVRHRSILIAQAMNYGTLRHLRWLIAQYGRRDIERTLARMPPSALRPRARRLARTLFTAAHAPHARRRAH